MMSQVLKLYLFIGGILVIAFSSMFTHKIYVAHGRSVKIQHTDNVLTFDGIHHDKWIVITTIQEPTNDIIGLSKIPGWKMVVLGDTKAPTGWRVENVIYLNVDDQKKLGYSIAEVTPYNSYTRKIIGYLFAIEHGAKIIYETDDDNFLRNFDNFLLSGKHQGLTLLKPGPLVFNPYSYFGQPTIWPRGYPLEHMGEIQPREFTVTPSRPPIIQQGLVNGDPDVDALFRITRKYAATPINVTFDEHAPAVLLPEGTYAPYNSQNTFFLYEAFWSLVLPVSCTGRVADIYRSVWVQKLIWMTGHRIAFLPPRTVQVRNPHSYIQDAKDEEDLYYSMGKFVHFLDKWHCTSNALYSCMLELFKDLVTEGILYDADVMIARNWINDLQKIGYNPPKLLSKKARPEVFKAEKVSFFAWEKPTCMLDSADLILIENNIKQKQLLQLSLDICSNSPNNPFMSQLYENKKSYEDVLLVVSVDDQPSLIPILELVFGSKIPHILYCGTEELDRIDRDTWKVTYLHMTDTRTMICLDTAVKMGYSVTGYLYLSPKTYLDIEKLQQGTLDLHKINTADSNFFVWANDIDKKETSIHVSTNMMDRLEKVTTEFEKSNFLKVSDRTTILRDIANINNIVSRNSGFSIYLSHAVAKVYVDVSDQQQAYGVDITLLLATVYCMFNENGVNKHNSMIKSVDYFKTDNVREIFCPSN